MAIHWAVDLHHTKKSKPTPHNQWNLHTAVPWKIELHQEHFNKPLILNGSGSNPKHAGCIIDGDEWQFKVSTNNEVYDDEIGRVYDKSREWLQGQFAPDNLLQRPSARACNAAQWCSSSSSDQRHHYLTGILSFIKVPASD
ncbi:hypothetical protein EDD17DRAFT_1505826 [Pisolithus thermaeus]|nr:hypothetical protein EDD17DRAFT_1505826 [Pisolithus thermaeus]